MTPHDYLAVAIIITALAVISIFSIRSSFRRPGVLICFVVENATQRASLLTALDHSEGLTEDEWNELPYSRSGVGETEEPDGLSATTFGGVSDGAPRLVTDDVTPA